MASVRNRRHTPLFARQPFLITDLLATVLAEHSSAARRVRAAPTEPLLLASGTEVFDLVRLRAQVHRAELLAGRYGIQATVDPDTGTLTVRESGLARLARCTWLRGRRANALRVEVTLTEHVAFGCGLLARRADARLPVLFRALSHVLVRLVEMLFAADASRSNVSETSGADAPCLPILTFFRGELPHSAIYTTPQSLLAR